MKREEGWGGGVFGATPVRKDRYNIYIYIYIFFVFEEKRTDITNYNIKIIFLTYNNKSGIKSLRGNEYYKARTD